MRTKKIKSLAIIEVLLISSIVFTIIVLFSSCKHTVLSANENDIAPNTNNNGGNGNGSGQIPCDPDSVYFDNTILPLFISNCAKGGCHDAASAQEGIILNSYTNIMNSGEITPGDPNEGDIMEAITETDPDKIMPPPGNTALTQQQINLIAQWISQGAQNNSCIECDTTGVTYNAKIKPLFDLKCVGCHSGSPPPYGINLTNYSGSMAAGQSGQLLGSVNHQSPYMAMPKNASQLPQCEIDVIRIWIQNQYPQ